MYQSQTYLWLILIAYYFQDKITFDKDKNYKIIADELYKDGILDDNENEIVNNPLRKVKTKDELRENRRKNNDVRF